MLWFLFALISAFSRGISSLLHRKIVLKESSSCYAFVFNLLSALFFIPFLIKEFIFPLNSIAWILVLASSVFWTAIALVGLKSYQLTHVSIRAPITESKVIFLFLLSIIILSESVFLTKVIGILLIFAGLLVLTYQKGKTFGRFSERGVQLTLLTAILSASVAIIDKVAMNYFTPGTFGFLVYFLPVLMLYPIIRNKISKLKHLIKNKAKLMLLAGMLGLSYYYFMLKAYSLAEVSLVFPIVRLSTIVAVLGGIIFLGEREDILRKIISTVIVIFGVLLLSGYFI